MNICSIAFFYIFSILFSEGLLTQEGKASYYGTKFHGRLTSSGERFNMHQLTAAHATLPFNTKVEVTNLRNNKTVIVRINDRMALTNTKVIDMSKAAAIKLDMVREGIGTVIIRQLPEPGMEHTMPADTVLAGAGNMG